MGRSKLAESGSGQELMLGSCQQVNLSSIKVGNSWTVWETEKFAFLSLVLVYMLLSTFRHNISVPSSRVKWSKKNATVCKRMNIYWQCGWRMTDRLRSYQLLKKDSAPWCLCCLSVSELVGWLAGQSVSQSVKQKLRVTGCVPSM